MLLKNKMFLYLWVFVEKFGVVFTKFLGMVFIARIISPYDYGVFSIVNYIILTATIIVDSGMGGSLIRKKNITDHDYSTVTIFNIGASIILGFLLISTSYIFEKYYDIKGLSILIQVMVVCLIFRGAAVVYIASMVKQLLFKEQAKIMIFSAIFSTGVAILAAVYLKNYWALVLQQIVESILVFLMCYIYGKKINIFSGFSKQILMNHLSFGTKLTASSFLDTLSSTLVISYMTKSIGVNFVGQYTQISRINELFIGVSSSVFDKAAFPILVKIGNDDDALYNYFYKLLSYICFGSYLLTVIIICCSDEIVSLVLGSQWSDYSWILELIAYCGFGLMIEVPMRSILKSQGYSGSILMVSIIKIIILFSILMCIHFFSSLSIIHGLVLASFVNAIVYILAVIKNNKKILPSRILLIISKHLLNSTGVIVAFWLLSKNGYLDFSSFPLLLTLFMKAIIVFLMYIFVAIVFRFEELKFFEKRLFVDNVDKKY